VVIIIKGLKILESYLQTQYVHVNLLILHTSIVQQTTKLFVDGSPFDTVRNLMITDHHALVRFVMTYYAKIVLGQILIDNISK